MMNRNSQGETDWQTRTYVYYSRYPAIKTTPTRRSWRKSLRRMVMYVRLVIVGAIMIIVGGIVPVLLSYELVFKPLLTISCNQCQIINSKPYFEFDYVFASALGVMGFMMPIIVLYIFIKIMRSRTIRHDLFH